jgi:pimeloyl-ACP methyl ester carboxylesterase
MESIEASGVKLSASVLGAGTPVALLHGLVFGNIASWYFPVALPLSAGRKVIVYDQRGHGDSDMVAEGYDLVTQADDLRCVLEHYNGEEKVDLVGHSVGALIALQFALEYPERVGRLVLVDAPLPAAQHVAPSLNAVSSRAEIDRFVNEQLDTAGTLSPRRREKLCQRLNRLIFESTLVQDVNAMAAPPLVELAALDVPVLLIYGEHSPCRDAGDWLMQVLPNASLLQLDCGHYIPQEAPQPLLAGIERFLARDGAGHA